MGVNKMDGWKGWNGYVSKSQCARCTKDANCIWQYGTCTICPCVSIRRMDEPLGGSIQAPLVFASSLTEGALGPTPQPAGVTCHTTHLSTFAVLPVVRVLAVAGCALDVAPTTLLCTVGARLTITGGNFGMAAQRWDAFAV